MVNVDFSECDKLEKIGNGAFCDCDLSSKFAFPKSITDIGASAFKGCAYLDKVNLSEYKKLEKIRASVFSHSGLSAITFPKGITDIGEKAFEGCKYLKEVNLSEYDKLTIIRNGAFYGCNSLKEITFPKNLIVIGANAFYGCI